MSATVRALTGSVLLAFLVAAPLLARIALADFEDGLKAYQAGDFRSAYDQWVELARDGDPAAMRNVGHLYRWGQGVEQDLAIAADWYRRAADMGLDRAQANLAMMYLQGQGVQEDPAQAAYWFSQAAIQGHTVAQFNLAQLYQQGRGVQRNEALALGWLQRAAKAGHPQALAQLGALVAEAPPPDPALQKRDRPADTAVAETGPPPTPPKATSPRATSPKAAPPKTLRAKAAPPPPETTLPPPAAVDTNGEETLETPVDEASPALVDRLAGVFGGETEAAPPPLPAPRPDAESGVAPPRPVATASPATAGGPAPDTAGSRSDAETWVLALITDAISDEPEAPARQVPSAQSPPPQGTAERPAPAEALPARTPSGSGSRPAPVAATAAQSAVPGDLGPLQTVAAPALRAYRNGEYGEARARLEPLARGGLGRAQYMLGWLYEAGQGGPADQAMAYYWYMRSSTGGDIEGRRALEDLQRRIDPASRDRARNLLIRGR